MSPPKLTGDTPVVYVFHPVDVRLAETFGNEFNSTVANDLQSRLCERLHLNEPLVRCKRLDRRSATVAGAYVVVVGNRLNKVAFRLKISNECLTAGISDRKSVV